MGKNLFILIVVAIVGALVSLVFLVADNVGVLLGWLLGSAVNIFAYVTIYKGSASLLAGGSSKRAYLAVVWAFLRILLYAGALFLAGFASFKWGTLSHGYCNLISTALALMPTWIVVVCAALIRHKKAMRADKPVEPKEVPKEEEDKGE